MMRSKSFYLIPALLILLLGTMLGMKLEATISSADTFEQLRKLEDAFLVINRKYVEEVDPQKAAEHAIEGMLEHLDPHSTYITADQVAELRESYQGSFGGVGIYFEVVRDTARVIAPISGGPSEEQGVMAGDRIVAINDSSAIGFTADDVRDLLKGEIGTKVTMTVQRQGVKSPIDFTITRGSIPIYTIDASYMLDDETGYIKVNRFAMTTHKEFMEHVAELKKQGMKRLMVDLRWNPGGVMEAAVKLADEFLGGEQTIVYTKGRDESFNASFSSTNGNTLEQEPVILLVNGASASASEIVAGALQDHDRALVVGQRTFGKGLVQRPFELSDGSLLQMTVSRYYTPVGRLIQTPYEDGDQQHYYEEKFESLRKTALDVSEYIDSVPDSLKFTTDRGRTVFGGGGILPDYFIPLDTMRSPLEQAINSGMLSGPMRDWFLQNEQQLRDRWGDRREAFMNSYDVDQATIDAFWDFAAAKDIKLTTDTAEVSLDGGVFAVSDVQENQEYFATHLKAMLARQLYGVEAYYPVRNQTDPMLLEAQQLWSQASELASYYTANAK